MIGTSIKRFGGQKIKGLNPIKIQNKQNVSGDFDSSVGSSLVQEIDYNEQEQTLQVTYKNGFKATYLNIDKDLYQDFMNAESKGKWARENLWGRKYI